MFEYGNSKEMSKSHYNIRELAKYIFIMTITYLTNKSHVRFYVKFFQNLSLT